MDARKQQEELSANSEQKQTPLMLVPKQTELQLSGELIKKAQHLKQQGIAGNYHIVAPLCIDPPKKNKPNLTKDQFLQLAVKLRDLGLPFTIMLVVNDDQAYRDFKTENVDAINLLKTDDKDLDPNDGTRLSAQQVLERQIIEISKWRNTDVWQRDSLKYTQLLESIKSDNVRTKLQESINAYLSNHTNASEENVRDHFIKETQDYVSWLKNTDGNPNLNSGFILLYPHSKPQVLENANQNAGNLGKEKNSLPTFKYHPDADVVQKANLAPQRNKSPTRIKSSTQQMTSVLNDPKLAVGLLKRCLDEGIVEGDAYSCGQFLGGFVTSVVTVGPSSKSPQAGKHPNVNKEEENDTLLNDQSPEIKRLNGNTYSVAKQREREGLNKTNNLLTNSDDQNINRRKVKAR